MLGQKNIQAGEVLLVLCFLVAGSKHHQLDGGRGTVYVCPGVFTPVTPHIFVAAAWVGSLNFERPASAGNTCKHHISTIKPSQSTKITVEFARLGLFQVLI